LKCDQYPCKYCFTSCAIRRKRTTFKPDELATTFVSLQREKRVDGLFLSSGIVPDANTTMEKMLATVERLRLREGYTGFIHLKLIPGADFEYIERAVELADRVSLNLEAPNQARLTELAPVRKAGGLRGASRPSLSSVLSARATGNSLIQLIAPIASWISSVRTSARSIRSTTRPSPTFPVFRVLARRVLTKLSWHAARRALTT
jgi:hypothetical protein